MKIIIVVIATNSYFPLGIRFIKKFNHWYRGSADIEFHLFSDRDPGPCLPEYIQYVWHTQTHHSWEAGTNSKFLNILSLESHNSDYIYYFDADTNVTAEFTEEWFIGDLVGGEHFGNRSYLRNCVGLDRNPQGQSYVPIDSPLPCYYYYGAFFGGVKHRVLQFCQQLREWQAIDQSRGYEPPVNDESYINKYFHYNPPTKMVESQNFVFAVSCKGGLDNTRNTAKDIGNLYSDLIAMRNQVIEIAQGKIVEWPIVT